MRALERIVYYVARRLVPLDERRATPDATLTCQGLAALFRSSGEVFFENKLFVHHRSAASGIRLLWVLLNIVDGSIAFLQILLKA